MKTTNRAVVAVWLALVLMSGIAPQARAQTSIIANNVPAGLTGNLSPSGWAFGNDFYVIKPISVQQLGFFDHGSDGIQGGATLTVQLYAQVEWAASSTCAIPCVPPGRF